MTLRSRLLECLHGTPLEPRLERFGESLLARRAADPALERLQPRALAGLARVAAANADAARWIAHRPRLLEQLADVSGGAGGLRARAAALATVRADSSEDLEGFLDELRALRRDEEHVAACLDFAGLAPFELVSEFLSRLAEAIGARALEAAGRVVEGGGGGLAVIGMGKIAGRELTYHSDLDLIFLSADDPATSTRAPRLAQRLIAYLSTATGAGVAYRIDARLRPSGRQGALVTTSDAFERYQRERAAAWEHLALMRARAIAGDVERAAPVLARIRAAVSGRGPRVWDEVIDMRGRVERERGADAAGRIPFKAGRGGLMDAEFLACAALLELGARPEQVVLPGVAAMLRAHAAGKRVDGLLDDYGLLRRVEARARFVAGRPIEELRTDAETVAVVAELVEPGLAPDALLDRVSAARGAIRSAWERVARARTIRALVD
jgi:glutamate-ammonia-ligase adenylyltransferase